MAHGMKDRFSTARWARPLLFGAAFGAGLGLLVASAVFRWGPVSYAGRVFVALLMQPPLTGLLLVGAALLGGVLLGRLRGRVGWLEGLAFAGALLTGGLLLGGVVWLVAGPGAPETITEVYGSPGRAFVRVWGLVVAEVFLWGLCGLGTARAAHHLWDGPLPKRVGATVGAVAAFVATVGVQPYLLQFGFPGPI